MEYVAHIVLPWCGSFVVSRSPANGGEVTYTSVSDLVADYESGALHPGEIFIAFLVLFFLSLTNLWHR